ncbi:MAG: UMP kinase [Endomicrobium sp.]|jgi:uridylate kinase|nr:UMP kinase [Endomicrobium sp.]
MNTKRMLLKLSGESFSDASSFISSKSLLRTVDEIKSAINNKNNVQLAIVVGAGNIWRGAGKFIERVTADKMGMLATIINAVALNSIFLKKKIKSRVFSSNLIDDFVEKFDIKKIQKSIEHGEIVIFAGGTGKPFFTTDTSAALMAAKIKAKILLKATQVNGIYNTDPKINNGAIKFESLTFKEVIDKNLKIMDTEAFVLCMQKKISIVVFDFYKNGNLKKILNGEKIGTTIV